MSYAALHKFEELFLDRLKQKRMLFFFFSLLHLLSLSPECQVFHLVLQAFTLKGLGDIRWPRVATARVPCFSSD